jgi:hypothetical protein
MDRYFTTNTTLVSAAVLSAVSPKGAAGTKVRHNVSSIAAQASRNPGGLSRSDSP